jgi:DNA-binding LacI/PurR family transcriptional regulator
MAAVADMLDVDISTVSRLLNNSKLGYYQIGRRKVVVKATSSAFR